MMIGLPDAMAGASLCATRLTGKLNGVIPRTGPMGNLRVNATRPSFPAVKSAGVTSPTIRLASSAATRNVSAARVTSLRASRMGFAGLQHQPAPRQTCVCSVSLCATRVRIAAPLMGTEDVAFARTLAEPARMPCSAICLVPMADLAYHSSVVRIANGRHAVP